MRFVAFTAVAVAPSLAAAQVAIDVEASDNATVQPAGPRSGGGGKAFFNVEGSTNGTFASFGVVDFVVPSTCTDLSGLSLALTQDNAGFTTDGPVSVYLTDATGVDIQPGSSITYQAGSDGVASVDPAFTNLTLLGSFNFVEGSTGDVDLVDLTAGVSPAVETALLAAINGGTNIRLVLTPDAATTAATYAGSTNSNREGPTLSVAGACAPPVATTASINEFHYDNASTDVGEFVEIIGPAGNSLDGWSLVRYNGNGGGEYGTTSFGATDVFVGDADSGSSGFVVVDFPSNGLQNGSPDGLALVDPSGAVVEFLSYEGSFVASDGPAAGQASTDIGVFEPGDTPIGQSLQRFATGFLGPFPETPGNTNVANVPVAAAARVNELHYDNAGGDTGEFVEIIGPAGTSLDGWQLVLYNGNGGTEYDTFSFDDTDVFVGDADSGSDGFVVVATPGLQNGSPDGLALVGPLDPTTGIRPVVEFLSYEGSFVAANGPAQGLASTDIGVSEPGDTPVGQSLQFIDGAFAGPFPETPGATNSAGFLALTIMQIQGAAQRSPEEGNGVETSGIVTAVGAFDAVGRFDEIGFYLQDPVGDGDTATSDGIFVISGAAVAVGDAVTVQGVIEENGFTTELTYTRLDASSVTVSSSGNALPAPVLIGAGGRVPPTETIDDDGVTTFDPTTDGLDFFESLEAMRVTVQSPVAISPTSRFGEIFVVVDGGAGATGISSRGTLNISPSDFNPEKIQIDPGRESFDSANFDLPLVDVGATFADITGVVGYDFGNFQVQPDGPISVLSPATITPESTALVPTDQVLVVASYNVLNLDPNDDPSETQSDTDIANGRFDAIARQIVTNLATPDVIGLQEIQDNSGGTGRDSMPDGVIAADVTLQTLVDAIVAAGGPTYSFIDNTFITANNSGGQPGANIRTAFLYDPSRVSLVAGSVKTVANLGAFTGARLPLIADFVFDGETVTVVNNHFSSKGGSAAIFGTEQPFEARQEDLTVNGSLDERQAQSAEVQNFVDSVLTADPEANLIVLGDFNEFEFVSPVQDFEPRLENLTTRLAANERYSFNFQGNSQSLDHILVSDALRSRTQFDVVHVNSEFAETPFRASDHDPLVAAIDFTPVCNGERATVFVDGSGTIVGGALDGHPYGGVLIGSFGRDVMAGTDGDDHVVGLLGDDVICGEDGHDSLFGGFGHDQLFGGPGDDLLFGGAGADGLDGGEGHDRCRGGLGSDSKTACE
jgi:hypothetical protein